MPEGDTVWLAARRMHAALAGRVLTASDFRVPQLATADVTGRAVHEVVSRGKHLLTRIVGNPPLTLHTHLRMDGTWHLYPAGGSRRGGPDWQVRVVLSNVEWQAVGYRLPVVELLPTSEEGSVVDHLGPDLLGPGWDPAAASRAGLDTVEQALAAGYWVEGEAVRRLRRHARRPIGEALLDQRNLAGIGTLYRAETLFLRGVHPRLSTADVPQLEQLVRLARRLLLANRQRPHQITTGDSRRGRQLYVFDRTSQPCRRCGTSVQEEQFGPAGQERRSFWCLTCQPAHPAPEATSTPT